MENPSMSGDVTSDDKLMALLMYLLGGLWHLILYFAMQDKRDRPFIRAHFSQSLGLWIVVAVVGSLLSWTCVVPLAAAIYVIFLAVKAFQGNTVEIPMITNFCKNQGWM